MTPAPICRLMVATGFRDPEEVSMPDDPEIAGCSIDLHARARAFRMMDLPGYWDLSNLEYDQSLG
jgi:hypothetical protein